MIIRIFISVLFVLSVIIWPGTQTYAVPEQRIIIQFEKELSPEQQAQNLHRLSKVIQSDYYLASHGTARRWIVVLKTPVSKTDIENILKSISSLSGVHYVEQDSMSGIFR